MNENENVNDEIRERFFYYLKQLRDNNQDKAFKLNSVISIEDFDKLKEYCNILLKKDLLELFDVDFRKKILKNKLKLSLVTDMLVDLYINELQVIYFLDHQDFLQNREITERNTHTFFDYERQIVKLKKNLKIIFKSILKPKKNLADLRNSEYKEKYNSEQKKIQEKALKEQKEFEKEFNKLTTEEKIKIFQEQKEKEDNNQIEI